MLELALPSRYESIGRLGKGGGGEVLAVRDRHTGVHFALKVLDEAASERELAALVREAVALSGLEGLGVPRVVRFGRLPGSGRAFLVRELVLGSSLEELIQKRAELSITLPALAKTADQLTLLHRAGLLHGDVKPANIIVQPDGGATLVDLGLAAPCREGGAPAEGLTPKYAAPELFEGKPLTVRAEVFALGATLDQMLTGQAGLERESARELRAVTKRATEDAAGDRYPSADEFASALRRAAQIGSDPEPAQTDVVWPIVGIDSTSARLLECVSELAPGELLSIEGASGSGRSALLRRLAWSLGVAGSALVWIDEELVESATAIEAELGAFQSVTGVSVLVDDAEALGPRAIELLRAARDNGAKLVVVGAFGASENTRLFPVPPLDERALVELVRRAIPSLTERFLKHLVNVSRGRPGELRRLVRAIASEAVASEEDIERVLGTSRDTRPSVVPDSPLERALYFLDRGRYNEAGSALTAVAEKAPGTGKARLCVALARARLELGLGEAGKAVEVLRSVEDLVNPAPSEANEQLWSLYLARAYVGVGEYTRALELASRFTSQAGAIGAEALAYSGLAVSYLGRHDEARSLLGQAVDRAKEAAAERIEAVAHAALGLALQRSDDIERARDAYLSAITSAERVGDAGTLATVQLNLAGLLKVSGDIAGAIRHFEAAVDMGRRSGRRSAVRNALLNLANTDLYLGRLARARASIEALEEQRAQLSPVGGAQLYGLQAELLARSGQGERAVQLYDTSAMAYEALGRGLDAAEARLEGVLVAARRPHPQLVELRQKQRHAKLELADTAAHRSLLLLAEAWIARLSGDEREARACVDEALSKARDGAQREWVWRALEARAELEEIGGQPVLARRDREEALAVLEEIAALLPRDLREVYWNDPRRRQLRAAVHSSLATASTELRFAAPLPSGPANDGATLGSRPISALIATPLEQRLARILEINSELAGELDLERLTARVIDHAVDLLRAERGFVLLCRADGSLSVHTSRSRVGDDPHAEFSRSIAAKVIETSEPIVSLSARDDARMKGFASVHQMMLQSVACVPILAPAGGPIGALYLETRLRPGAHFEAEIGTLRAFADQVAIAFENARLVNENRRRANELAESNRLLEEAQENLKELLDDRTVQLKRARRKLRETRDTLYGHFGYLGLVGTSAAMRRMYALIDRVKDTDVPVLITGESGTGKEVVARAIHTASPRGKHKFLGVNCGAIPEHLLESELFGHVRGAFTGADRDRKGLFREAEHGSILLDEIGEMPHKMQAGLLRVVQDRTVRPVGGVSEEAVNVRLLFATNKDLGALVKEGRFREDLYYRIHVVELRLPPLRERLEDVPQLVDHFLGIFAARYKREKKSLTRDAMRRLGALPWPGNVRQLEHVLLNAWVLSDEPELDVEDFDLAELGVAPGQERMEQASTRAAPTSASAPSSGRSRDRISRPNPSLGSSRRAAKSRLSQHRLDERERIIEALQACNWNRVRAAEMSGIPRRTFYRRLREYGIQ